MSTSAAARDTFQSWRSSASRTKRRSISSTDFSRTARFSSLSSWLVRGTVSEGGRGGWRISDGQLGRTDDGPGAQQADPLHDILEFPHVAGPWVIHQQLLGFGRDFRDFLSGFFAEPLEEVHGQERDIFASFAQRRQHDGHDIDAVEQFLAERSRRPPSRRGPCWWRR